VRIHLVPNVVLTALEGAWFSTRRYLKHLK